MSKATRRVFLMVVSSVFGMCIGLNADGQQPASTPYGKPTEENGYYVSGYQISRTGSLPFNCPSVIEAHFAYPEKGMTWTGARQPLASGFEYRIIDNPRTVTLTEAQRRAEVNFEISMAPVGSSQLQRRTSTRP